MIPRQRLTATLVTTLMLLTAQQTFAQDEQNEYYLNESVAAARGAMGLFANGYSRALAAKAFDLKPYSLKNRLASAMMAAVSYQMLSFEKNGGLTVRPLQWDKQWRGYWQGYLSGEALDAFLGLLKKYNGVKFLVGSTLAAATGVMVIEGENGQTWRYAQDGPLTMQKLTSNRHSYWIHFAGSGGVYWAFSRHVRSQELALAYTTFFIWMWEIKDGYIHWEQVGFLGGDGFSWADGWAGSIAAVGSYLISKVLRFSSPRDGAAKRTAAAQRKVHFGLQPREDAISLSVRLRF